MRIVKPTLLALFGSALLAGCSETAATENAWRPVPIAELNAAQTVQYGRAEAARSEMFDALVKTLMTEVATSGPAGAIHVCKDEAPRVASSTSSQLEVRIGRTSWKLRNPQNTAPAWAETLLADRPAEPRAAAGPGGHLGVTLPIEVLPPCLVCHGTAEAIPEDVREALAAEYPDDRATGFESGDLRGWFWVEVPPATD